MVRHSKNIENYGEIKCAIYLTLDQCTGRQNWRYIYC